MPGTALQRNALERNNLLAMPSAQVHPGQDLTLTFRYNGGIFSADPPRDFNVADFVALLQDRDLPFFMTGAGAVVNGNAVSIGIKAKSTIPDQSAEAFFATVKHVSGGLLSDVDYDLLQAVPSVLGHQAGAFSPADAAGINHNDPAYMSPAARTLSNVGQSVTSGIRSAGAAAQSISHTIIIILVLLLVGAGLYFAAPFLSAMGRKAA